MLRPFFFAAALSAFLPAASASNPCDDACFKRIQEGHAFVARGKYQEAFERFEAARVAAPQAALPLSAAAALLQDLSTRVAPKQTAELRDRARQLAQRALALDADDALAQEALRKLDEDAPSPLREPNPAAAKVLDEAEVFFSERRLAEALVKYKEAMALDPLISMPWVGAGDCHFFQKQWSDAEQFFRRATELEPRNSQAWRFLSDALVMQDKRKAGEQALVSAIAADPSQLPNWHKLGMLHAGAGLPLKPLGLRRGFSTSTGADGKPQIAIEEEFTRQAGTLDMAFRMALALGEIQARTSGKEAGKDAPRTAFDIELAAWRYALRIIQDVPATDGRRLADPALRQMHAFAKDGQLEAALLVLTFRQSYRPALEAWLAREPGGVKGFIDRYGLRP
ncbi:MAG: tetratricopeptide repeat protein [Telluria sp.]